MTAGEVFRKICQDRPFFDESGGGITVSGGEPLLQIEFLCELLVKCKENGIDTVIDTAGCVSSENVRAIYPLTDLFLYDLKIFNDEKHKRFTGNSNKLSLRNLISLGETNCGIWVRIPLIRGVNDSHEEISSMARFLALYSRTDRVELLPYHDYGVGKYRSLGKTYMLHDNRTPDQVFLKEALAIFLSHGLKAGINT
jgi:pyruvate formate lyase activating enzyme